MEMLRVGPFVSVTTSGVRDMRYRGQRTAPISKVAFSYLGTTQIEIIQQTNDAPSPYVDFLAGGREGLQHIGLWTEDAGALTTQLGASGFREIYTIAGGPGEAAVTYFEAPSQFGTM